MNASGFDSDTSVTKSSGNAGKPQNHKLNTIIVCSLVFITPGCLLNLETQQHFMSFSRVYEFLSFTLIVVYVSVTWQENVAQRIVLLSQHLKDSFVKPKQNAVKFLFANIL